MICYPKLSVVFHQVCKVVEASQDNNLEVEVEVLLTTTMIEEVETPAVEAFVIEVAIKTIILMVQAVVLIKDTNTILMLM